MFADYRVNEYKASFFQFFAHWDRLKKMDTSFNPSVFTLYIDPLTAENQTDIRRNLFFHQKKASLYKRNNLIGNSIATFNSIPGHSENLSQDPLFVTQAPQDKYDYLLRKGSPTIDQGVALGQSQDILGKPISGSGPDRCV